MAVFGKRPVSGDNNSDAPITIASTTQSNVSSLVPNIIVPKSAFESNDPHDLVQAVVNFVNGTIREGIFTRDEIPPNAMNSYHADYYYAQVLNGGHGQYSGNSSWLHFTINDCQRGLELMQAGAFLACHTELVIFAKEYPERHSAACKGSGFGSIDPIISNLDDRFFAAEREVRMVTIHAAWLKTLPEIRVVDDTAYKAELNALYARNAKAAQRKAEQEKAAQQDFLKDPLHQAFTYLCLRAKPDPIVYLKWTSGHPNQDIGNNQTANVFTMITSAGNAIAYINKSFIAAFADWRFIFCHQ
jgi:hypothetical protein